ncbi:hypothetical protein HYU07_02715 [Candidatus Woesearchaeota archaeon]|nr:hypothetical protein [Candidatus Woesearchaeota archaeon]
MSELIFSHKHRDKNYIVEIDIYKVEKDEFHPEGFQYSLALIKDGKRVLGYDNHERKGHHIHRGNMELPYEFVDEWKLVEDFQKDIERITKGEVK